MLLDTLCDCKMNHIIRKYFLHTKIIDQFYLDTKIYIRILIIDTYVLKKDEVSCRGTTSKQDDLALLHTSCTCP
jgi:hypothetical protein